MKEPHVVYLVEKEMWELGDAYTYSGYGVTVAIPQGFLFDLASIPRFLWRMIAPFELSIPAPLVHDYLYSYGGRLPDRTLTKEDADNLFLNIMRDEGVPWWKQKAAYWAVRCFGDGEFQ